MNTKKCKGPCGKVLPLEEFGADRRSKDGKQPKCKPCTREYLKGRRKLQVTPQVIKDVSKLNQIMDALPACNNNLGAAYHTLGQTKSIDVAKVQAHKFLERVSDEALETVLANFRNPEKASALIAAFDNYIASVLANGTHTEQRDMFREAFRIFGFGADKHEIRGGGIPADARQRKLEEIQKVIQGEVVSTEEVSDGE